uniref:Replication-associated protein n=1 Tax=Red panda feces-associated gemycircularvirus TaxID=2864013 RepID=A0A8K1M4J7_9VIRU|nr:replication-associated protein [Red panda feces-associated gemycircularvirus]
MSFTFNSRYVLLTYAQSGDLSEWSILEHISGIGAECIIGREDHVDEGTHLHVFCDFGRKFRSRRSDVFDVDGRHPNIVPSRGRPEFGWDYAVKDGNVVAGGLGRPGSGGLPSTTDKWGEIVSAESRDEFLRLVQELDPKSFVLRHRELLDYADRYYAEEREPYVGPDGIEFDLGMVPELAAWRRESLGNDPIAGATLLRDMPDADYAVFDDMRGGISMFPSFKEWLGAQSVVTVKKLYRDPVQVKWGRPCIWLANSDPRDQLQADITDHTARGRVDLIYGDIAWLEANCTFVELKEPIFRANTE